MTTPPMTDTQNVCASDPNFAVIFAFCEQFGDNCGVTIPTFQELQDMLEKTNEVPDALINLHIKLLRRVKKSVHVDKWEKAIIKFCQVYSIPEFWELERYGYKGISVQLKLKILKTLFEAQFDSNVKFKAEINKLESSALRPQPLGWDKSGTAYWVQFDKTCNLRVYKEDIDEDTWKIVAQDRSTLVKLINDLSGSKDTSLDDIDNVSSTGTISDTEIELSPNINQDKHFHISIDASPTTEYDNKDQNTNESNIELNNKLLDQKNNSLDDPINLKRKLIEEDDNSHKKIDVPIVGETIEECVMIVKGEGSGNECETGNPDEINTQNDTTKNEDVKKPKLWSIETICSSSKEVAEEIISVPTTGFFFGDDSVPCLNNVSNGESSHIDENKLEIESFNAKDEELVKNKKTDDINSTLIAHDLKECDSKIKDELSSNNTLKQSVFNIKVHEEEVQITERNANDVFTKSELSKKDDVYKTNVNESISADVIHSKSSESLISSSVEFVEIIKDKQLHTLSDKHQNKIDEFNVDSVNEEIKNDLSNKQALDNLKLTTIDTDNQINIQDTINVKSENTFEDKIEQQLTTTIINQTMKNVKHIFEEKTNEQLTNEIKSNYEAEQVNNSCEKVNENELLTNPIVQFTDIHEQKNIDKVEENPNILNKSMVDIADSAIVKDNQILIDDCNIVDNKEKKICSIIEGNENKQLSKDIVDHGNDYSEKNASCSNYNLNQQNKSEKDNSNAILCTNECNNEIYDQNVVTNVNECFKSSNQINNDQNYKKSKKTSHNISNIIETVNDSDTKNKELTFIKTNENIQIDNCKIKNQNHLVNLSQKAKSNVNVDYQIISNNKHSLDKIVQKSHEIKEISHFNPKEESTKVFKLNDLTESSNMELEIKVDKKDLVKSELNTKNIDILKDLTVGKKSDEPKKDENNSVIVNEIIHENQNKIIDTINKTPKLHMNDELPTICMKQFNEKIKEGNLEIDNTEITLKKTKNDKELVNTENKDNILYEKKLNSEKSDMCNNKTMHDLYESPSLETPIIIDKKNNREIVQLDENVVVESTKNNDNLANKESKLIVDNNMKDQNLIKVEKTKVLEEEDISNTSEEQIINSPVNEDIYESTDENNEETVIGRPIKEHNDSEIIDTNKVDDKIHEEEEIEETPKKRGRPGGRKKGKKGKAKKITVKQEIKNNIEGKIKRSYKPRQKKVTIAEEVITFPEPTGDDNKRRSRRIAEIKIKEQFIPTSIYDDIDIPIKGKKKNDKTGKKASTLSKKIVNIEESDDEDEEDTLSKKFKKKKKKAKVDSPKKLNKKNPWNVDSGSSSSENNIELFEDYDHEEEEEIPRPGIELNISDHEFSPESDINDDDEYLPEKRARTAHKKDQSEQLKDDMCQKCNKSDQPEWILLCDTCNQGWHASCLRPPLMVIPDGDWYCPPCRHDALLNALKDTLKRYDGESKKRENEELRRKRLAYVGISLQNVISSKPEEIKSEKKVVINESSEDDDDEDSESESYDSEPLYQLRARQKANVSYRFNDYDDMINEAILEETGIDESAVRKSIEVKTDKNDNDEGTHSNNDDENDRCDSPIAPALLHLRGRKKSKKLTNLDISSDDGSDEDFKGPSDGDDDYEEEDMSEYSDDSVKRRPQPTRRSVRNRKTLVDPDFINDDSSEESDLGSKKKRSRPWSDSSNSEEEDLTWGKKKKKRTGAPQSSSFSYKQPKGTKRKHSVYTSSRKPKKSKIKYGMDSDSDFDDHSKRRTRARQITYAESDDSEVEVQTKKRKIISDEEDEYVLNDEELEAENEDHNLEVDDEDAVSNEEKDEDQIDDDDDNDDDDGGEAAINDDEEEELEDEEKEEEEDEPKQISIEPITPQKIPIKSPSTSIQSVIQEPTSTGHQSHKVHSRLLPPTNEDEPVANLQTSIPTTVIESPTEKRKRPSHQIKKCPSPKHKTDYSDSNYQCPPDATIVMSTVSQPSVHIAYNRLPPTQGLVAQPTTTIGGFKSNTIVTPPSGFPPTTSFRNVNKIAATTSTVVIPPAYIQPPPQLVQQVYQTPPPPTNFSSYPIDYTAAGVPLPPPPPTIPFRNVVVAPPMAHEPLTVPQQSSGAAGGDSEFGGLVSYFSSQQEDDFDT